MRKNTPVLLFLQCWWVLLVIVGVLAEGKSFRPICPVDPTIEELIWDENAGRYRINNSHKNDNNNNIIINNMDNNNIAATMPPHERNLQPLLRQSHSRRNGMSVGVPATQQWEWTPAYPVAFSTTQTPKDDDADDERTLQQQQRRSRFDFHPAAIVYARYCSCTSYHGVGPRQPVYCPLVVNYCGVPEGYARQSEPLGCLADSRSTHFIKNTFWILFFFFLTVAAWLLCSIPGQHLIHFAVASVFPCWNDYLVTRMLQYAPERAWHMMRRNIYLHRHLLQQHHPYDNNNPNNGNNNNNPEVIEFMREVQAVARMLVVLQQQQQALEEQQRSQDSNNPHSRNRHKRPNRATSLKLKTRIYRRPPQSQQQQQPQSSVVEPHEPHTRGGNNNSNHHVNNNHMNDVALEIDESDPGCIICYQNLEDGQKVGDLTCGHVFHVECLKQWCQRRNVCPLCQQDNIATPQFPAPAPPPPEHLHHHHGGDDDINNTDSSAAANESDG